VRYLWLYMEGYGIWDGFLGGASEGARVLGFLGVLSIPR
jgi:hypothetical protein